MNEVSTKFIRLIVTSCLIQVLLISLSEAQQGNIAQSHSGMAHLQDLEKHFGPHFAARLSSGGANAFQMARKTSV
jgi:hypothetical protein